MHVRIPKLAKFFQSCIHVPRFNRGGSEKGERAGVESREKERREKEKVVRRRHDGRKGQEGRHGMENSDGGNCTTAPRGTDVTGKHARRLGLYYITNVPKCRQQSLDRFYSRRLSIHSQRRTIVLYLRLKTASLDSI